MQFSFQHTPIDPLSRECGQMGEREKGVCTGPGVTGHQIQAGDVALLQHGLHPGVRLGNFLGQQAVVWGSQCLHVLFLQHTAMSARSADWKLSSMRSALLCQGRSRVVPSLSLEWIISLQ